MKTKRILVTDGNNRAALSIVRSLGQKGHKVIVGEIHDPSLASSSRYCSSGFSYPDPFKNMDGFIETIKQTILDNKIDVLLPVSDITTLIITENKNYLERYCSIPFPAWEKVDAISNKFEMIKTAQKLGIPVPRTHFLMSPDELSSIPKEMPYPFVIKPHKSRIKSDHQWISTSVTYASNPGELRSIIHNKNRLEFPLLLQERIYGPGMGVFACYCHGKSIALFSHRRIREKPPSGGVSVLRESIPLSPAALSYTEAILNLLKWDGVAMVEFKLDQRDHVPKLMEINGRFWGSLQLAIDAGVDFPSILIRSIDDGTAQPIPYYKMGVKTRWLWGDLDALLMILLRKNTELNLPPGHEGKAKYLFNFLKLWGRKLHYEVLSFRDIKPWIYETLSWFSKFRSSR